MKGNRPRLSILIFKLLLPGTRKKLPTPQGQTKSFAFPCKPMIFINRGMAGVFQSKWSGAIMRRMTKPKQCRSMRALWIDCILQALMVAALLSLPFVFLLMHGGREKKSKHQPVPPLKVEIDEGLSGEVQPLVRVTRRPTPMSSCRWWKRLGVRSGDQGPLVLFKRHRLELLRHPAPQTRGGRQGDDAAAGEKPLVVQRACPTEGGGIRLLHRGPAPRFLPGNNLSIRWETSSRAGRWP